MNSIWHASLPKLTVDKLGIMLERHAQIIFRPDLGFGGHLLEEYYRLANSSVGVSWNEHSGRVSDETFCGPSSV